LWLWLRGYKKVFLPGNEFFGPKKEKNSLNRVKNCFPSNWSIWELKNPYFYADEMGLLTFVTSSYQKLAPKYSFLQKLQVIKNVGSNF
jgi:hypothetical protein